MILNNEKLRYGTPEEQGISSASILKFFQTVQENNDGNAVDLHSFQIIKNDCIIAEGAGKPLSLNRFHRIYSSAKAIVALGVMLAVQEGKVSLEEKVVDIFAENLPEKLDERMKKVTVYHLLTMNSGQAVDTCVDMFRSDNWIQTFLSIAPVYEPGSHFFYNNGIPHVLAAIVKEKTGEDIFDYMGPRLLEPMGVEIRCRFNRQMEREPSTVCVTQESLTKFGYLMLNKGMWNQKQLIDRELCEEFGRYHTSTAHHGKIFRQYGYGYQVWKMPCEGYVMAGGNDNHSCIFTEANMVFSCMAKNTKKNVFSIQKAFYDIVYLNMNGRPLPPDPEAYGRLMEALEQWNIAPSGKGESGAEENVSGKTYHFEENPFHCESIRFTFGEQKDEVLISSVQDGKEHVMRCGLGGTWPESADYLVIPPNLTHGNFIDGEDQTVNMASGAWQDGQKFLVYGRSYGRIASDQFHFRFEDGGLNLEVFTPALALPGCSVDKKSGEFRLKAHL